ncbi:MAG: cysteine--tRNA ligase, partial [Phycisphaerales bacterium]|nr:cysteine--tRNA ligase [Phycisphaerales bacterium]
GWHLECSAMAAAYLGEQIDFHSGGEDNIFPHHECEIAQSCCGFDHESFARVWFHTRHLVVEGEKMSKSKGNFFTVRDVLARGITPAALRLELVRMHYRTNANFTWQGLRDGQRQIDRWSRARTALQSRARSQGANPAAPGGPFATALEQFTAALCDDLNVGRAIAALNGAVSDSTEAGSPSACPHAECAALTQMDSVLSVLDRNEVPASLANDGAADGDAAAFKTSVEALIAARTAARAARDWPASDRVRDELAQLGVQIKDGASGTTWTRA